MLTKCKRNAHACTEEGTNRFRGGLQVLKFCVLGDQFIQSGGPSILRLLVRGTTLRGDQICRDMPLGSSHWGDNERCSSGDATKKPQVEKLPESKADCG